MAQTAGGYALEVLDLECVRGDVLVFEHLSFGVQQGQVLQILGANGSGKTSLLRMLVGLAAPAGGEIRWHGESILNTLDWTNRMLYQGIHNGFSASLTVSENLEYATAVAGRGTRMRVAESLDRVGLAKHHGTLLGRLSSGQRQRVALARLMLIPADAWLLDEPLTALDRDGKHLLECMLSAHVNAGGIALVATHQPLELPPESLTTLDMDGRRAC